MKILKTSSDGKLEGFSFRVIGNNYDQIFKTNEKGEITISDLRIGEYSISEVKDNVSERYILPADKQITIAVDDVVTVSMHNELRDTPKTGDDFNLALWIGLASVSVIGAGIVTVIGLKKKKRED